MQFTGKGLRKNVRIVGNYYQGKTSLNLETSFDPPVSQLKMTPNPHVSNNTNKRLKVFQFATFNI